MRLPHLILAAALAVSSLLAAPPARVAACSCAGTTTAQAEALSEIVFVGSIVDSRPSPGTGEVGRDEVAFLFAVDEVSKGRAVDVAVVNTYAGGGVSCSAPFSVGDRWLVYGFAGRGDAFTTNLCVPNQLQSKAGDAPLAAVQWPEDDDSVAPVIRIAVAGLVIALGLAVVMWRRRSGAG
jgi:hypothetical protein